MARLADQRTTVETKEMVRGWLSFVADDGVTDYAGQVDATESVASREEPREVSRGEST